MADSEVDRVLAAMRDGKTAQVGGGRCFSIYSIRDGQPLLTTSDEGHQEDLVISEARLREVIAEEPELFRDYLRHWQR